MGYVIHHAIVATSWSIKDLQRAHKQARALGLQCSEITPPITNGYQSFFIAPDGSKEGWEESIRGDKARAQWKDGVCGYVEWVEVTYGSDLVSCGGDVKVTDDSTVEERL